MVYAIQLLVLIFAFVGIEFILVSSDGLSEHLTPSSAIPAPTSSRTNSSWTNGTSMPTPRSEMGAVVLGEKIYVIGGQDLKAKKLNVVEVYDLKADKWSTGAPLPQAVDHPGVAFYGGKLYVVGGTTEKTHTTDKLFIYDAVTNKWREGKPMPTSRTMLTADFIDGILYAVGGVNSSYSVISTNEAYDPKSDTWTTKTPMPTSRHHAASEVVDGKLYVIGGRRAGDGISYSVKEALLSFNNNEMFDPAQNKWTSLQPMPSNRSSMAAASVNGDIYVFGGQSRVKTPADFLVFGGKSRIKTVPEPRGIEMLFVGQPANGTLDKNEQYDTNDNTWTSELPLPTPRLGSESVALEDKIYVIGGKPSLGADVTGIVEIYYPGG